MKRDSAVGRRSRMSEIDLGVWRAVELPSAARKCIWVHRCSEPCWSDEAVGVRNTENRGLLARLRGNASFMTHGDSFVLPGLVIRRDCFSSVVMNHHNRMEMSFVAHESAWTSFRGTRSKHATEHQPQREEHCRKATSEGKQRVHEKDQCTCARQSTSHNLSGPALNSIVSAVLPLPSCAVPWNWSSAPASGSW